MKAPFDLEKAKAGNPIITREGVKFRFIAYIPELENIYNLIVFDEKEKEILFYTKDGKCFDDHESKHDLFMDAENPKRVVMYKFAFAMTDERCWTETMSFYENENQVREDEVLDESFLVKRLDYTATEFEV